MERRPPARQHGQTFTPAETGWQGYGILTLAVAIAGTVYVASLLGIVSRPDHQLAVFWPTNAVLLGLFIRNPSLAGHPLVWLAACLGYIGADLSAGDTALKSLKLTLANLAGVAAGTWMAQRVAIREHAFSRPAGMLWLLLVCGFASLWAGIAGTLVGGSLLRMDILRGFGFWFSAELVSYLALAPAVLLAPSPQRLPDMLRRGWLRLLRRPRVLLPLATLLCSVLVATWMGGPGALMLPLPALLWCALNYRVFSTALVTMAMCVWALVSIASGTLQLMDGGMGVHDTISLRIGVALMAVAPLTVAAVSAARRRLLLDLDHAASHDALTGLLGRGAFLARAGAWLPAGTRPVTLMMLDIDHFKGINDRYGHAGGDRVLEIFAARMRSAMRPGDLVGRFGGEEFAILLPDTPPEVGAHVADRLLRLASETPVKLDDAMQTTVTVSIGALSLGPGGTLPLEHMLKIADLALYDAKSGGRNRVVHTVLD